MKAASLRCGGGGSGWVPLSPTLMGVGANRPPRTGGQLTFGAPGVALPLSVHARWRRLGLERLLLFRRL